MFNGSKICPTMIHLLHTGKAHFDFFHTPTEQMVHIAGNIV